MKVRFVGVTLAGGKTDKTSICVLEYFPKVKKLILSQIIDRIKSESEVSSDSQLVSFLTQLVGDKSGKQEDQDRQDVAGIGWDAPRTWPKCMRCDLVCPGIENCSEPEIRWFWQNFRKDKRKNKKLFTPYTQRPVEYYLSKNLEEKFEVHDAGGANMSPLMMRARFLWRRLYPLYEVPWIECFPRLSVWRLGLALGVRKSVLRSYRHLSLGLESRRILLKALVDQGGLFIYDQDEIQLLENVHVFEALFIALTVLLKGRNRCEARPLGFPEGEAWIDFPILETSWINLFH